MMSSLLFSVFAVAAFQPSPYLNDLLMFQNGTAVTTLAQWETRREELKGLLQDTLFGRVPETTPQRTSATIMNETKGAGVTSTFVQLNYSCGVSTSIEILRPSGEGVFPLFLTQWNHRDWAALGAQRGYVGITYMGGDLRDSAPEFQKAYPNSSWALIIARAWVASRVLDYALTLEYVDPTKVSLSGHSRNGKQSLIAAAFDTRIGAVVGSSPGAPIASPFHFTSSNFYGEGPRTGGVAGSWWLESILQYDEHPENLPVDGHAVLALIAPRFVVVATARTDFASDMTFAGEMCLRAASGVYQKIYKKPENARIITRSGDHHGFDDFQTYFDWFDTAFDRRTRRLSAPAICSGCWIVKPEDLTTYTTAAGFSWDNWNNAYGPATPPVPQPSAPLRTRVSWLLQLDSAGYAMSGGGLGEEKKAADYIPGMLRHAPNPAGITMFSVGFGIGLDANVYFPSNLSTGPHPALIWLHPYSYNTGYSPNYMQETTAQYMAGKGYIVMAFDQIGFGLRNARGGNLFYDRVGGEASLFGRMVQEVSMAVDFLTCKSSGAAPTCAAQFVKATAFNNFPSIDPQRISVAGYSLGGNVALHAAALDPRIFAVASFSGWTPMRTDFASLPTGGIARLFDLHGIIPRLGFFSNNESSVPYDYEELLMALSPRHALVYTPQMDRDATYADVLKVVTEVKNAGYSNLIHSAPKSNSKFEAEEAAALSKWFAAL